jgi:hypothetical protein
MFLNLLLTTFGSSFLHAVVDRAITFEVVTRREQHYSLPTSTLLSTHPSRPDNVYSPLLSTPGNRSLVSLFTREPPHSLSRRFHTHSVLPSPTTTPQKHRRRKHTYSTSKESFHPYRRKHLSQHLTGHHLPFSSSKCAHRIRIPTSPIFALSSRPFAFPSEPPAYLQQPKHHH